MDKLADPDKGFNRYQGIGAEGIGRTDEMHQRMVAVDNWSKNVKMHTAE